MVILKCDPSGKGPGTLTKFNQEGNTYVSSNFDSRSQGHSQWFERV